MTDTVVLPQLKPAKRNSGPAQPSPRTTGFGQTLRIFTGNVKSRVYWAAAVPTLRHSRSNGWQLAEPRPLHQPPPALRCCRKTMKTVAGLMAHLPPSLMSHPCNCSLEISARKGFASLFFLYFYFLFIFSFFSFFFFLYAAFK